MNMPIDNIYAIILAAGASTRMGGIKQLLEWQHRSLLEHAIEMAELFVDERIIVVLGAHAKTIQVAVNLNTVTTIINSDWREGIASSIRAGILALPETAKAVLFLLCDQPLINANTVEKLLTGWQNEPTCIVACQYGDSIGVPVVFPAEFFSSLLDLKGDQGAKSLLFKYSDRLLTFPLSEPALDIDTLSDFNHLTRHYPAEE